MSATPPSPQEALRGFSHAVILTADGGSLGPVLQHAINQVGLKVEILGHPLTAMASLCWHEFNSRRAGDSTVLVVADRPIDDLNPLFAAVSSRLPHVHALMLQSDLMMPIITGRRRVEGVDTSEGFHAVESFDVVEGIKEIKGVDLDSPRDLGGRASAEGRRFEPLVRRQHPRTSAPSLRIIANEPERINPPQTNAMRDEVRDGVQDDEALKPLDEAPLNEELLDELLDPPPPSATRITQEEFDALFSDDNENPNDSEPPMAPRGGR